MTVIIPKDYYRICESEFRNMKAEVFFSRDNLKFFIKASETDGIEKVAGPFSLAELEAIDHAIRDALEMKGRYGAI